jgi:hypothetical protein
VVLPPKISPLLPGSLSIDSGWSTTGQDADRRTAGTEAIAVKLFKGIFHAGIALGVVVLIVSACSSLLPTIRPMLTAEMSLAYLSLSLGHVALLVWQGFRLDPRYARMAAESLYTVGFLHTLMALGLAVILSGTLLSDQETFKLQTLGLVLYPMGSALVPHAVGVWMGYELASRHQDVIEAVEESVFKRLTEDAEAAREVIQELYRRREELLKEQTASLREQVRLFNGIKEHLTEAMNLATRTLEDFVKTTNSTSKDIGSGMEALAGAVQSIHNRAQTLKEELQASAGEVKTFHTAIKETSEVIRDLNRLHRAIVELLSSDLFRRER